MRPHEAALTWLGTPFQHMGRSHHGLDCVGLLMVVAEQTNTPHVDNPHYGREPSWHNHAFDLQKYLLLNCGEPVEREIEPDDVLLIRLKPHYIPSHLAIAAPHPHGMGMIHTHSRSGRVVFHRIDDRWKERIVEVYAWPAKH